MTSWIISGVVGAALAAFVASLFELWRLPGVRRPFVSACDRYGRPRRRHENPDPQVPLEEGDEADPDPPDER